MEEDEFFPEHYDMEDVFDEKIHPLLRTIVNICSEYNIPMVTCFQYANDKQQIKLSTSTVLPAQRSCQKIKMAAQNLSK